MNPQVVLDHLSSKPTETVWVVIPDGSDARVVCRLGRVHGSKDRYTRAAIEGYLHRLSATDCRALAAALTVAADVLEGGAR